MKAELRRVRRDLHRQSQPPRERLDGLPDPLEGEVRIVRMPAVPIRRAR
jgi:hypothetical protein